MIRAVLALGFAASAALTPIFATASDADDALVLAQRIAGRGGQEAHVLLHAVPPDLPAVPLPAATLLGSVSQALPASTNGLGWTAALSGHPTELYYDAPDRDAAVASYEAELRRKGWTRGESLADRLPLPQGGFTLSFPQLRMWCSPSGSAVPADITLQEPQSPASALDVGVGTGAQVNLLCAKPGSLPAFPMLLPPSPLPKFRASAGIDIAASGPSGDGTTTAARITSSLPLAAVFESFAKQLRDAGWSAGEPAASAGMRSATFTKTVNGTSYVAMLAIYALDAGHYAAVSDVGTR
ncbi:MAG TPA: hypothetical protein VFB22_09320 [Candidatus Baltobacteraceae bacterium]|nr:hypothetical protein [Candidatus Baltobacteraceae bacterium]